MDSKVKLQIGEMVSQCAWLYSRLQLCRKLGAFIKLRDSGRGCAPTNKRTLTQREDFDSLVYPLYAFILFRTINLFFYSFECTAGLVHSIKYWDPI